MIEPARIRTIVLVWLVLATPVFAQHAIEAVDEITGPSTRYDGDCVLGNQGMAHTYSGWWSGSESYARLIEPRDGRCSCSLGIAIQSVHMALWLEPGTTQLVQCRLLEAISDGPGCWIPGDEFMTSEWQVIRDITAPGVRDVEIPTYFWCAEVLEPYFVSVDFVGGNAPGLRLIGGGSSAACRPLGWSVLKSASR